MTVLLFTNRVKDENGITDRILGEYLVYYFSVAII